MSKFKVGDMVRLSRSSLAKLTFNAEQLYLVNDVAIITGFDAGDLILNWPTHPSKNGCVYYRDHFEFAINEFSMYPTELDSLEMKLNA